MNRGHPIAHVAHVRAAGAAQVIRGEELPAQGFTVPLKTKEDDFIGKESLIKRKENPQRVLVGLELNGDELAANGDCVNIGRNQVGEITSAVRSPILRKNVDRRRKHLAGRLEAVTVAALEMEKALEQIESIDRTLDVSEIISDFSGPQIY